MTAARWAVATVVVCLGVVLQASVFSAFSTDGVVPDLVLLVVVAWALARGAQSGMILGFVAGLLLDLAPPADGTVGRWALSLLVVGYVAGQAPAGRRAGMTTTLALVAGCSFVGSATYALTGLLLDEHVAGFTDVVRVVALGFIWDVALALVVVPPLVALFTRLGGERVRA